MNNQATLSARHQGRILVSAALSLALVGLFCWPVMAETGWQVTQAGDASPMGAGTTMLVSANALRVSSGKGKIVMLMTAPSWNVVLLNTQAKTMFQTTLNDWLKTASQDKRHNTMEGATWKRGATNKIAQMRACAFVMDKPPAKPVSQPGTRVRAPVTSAELWVAQDIETSPAVSNLFAKLYGIPDCRRLPLRLLTGSNGPATMRLDTVAASGVALSSSQFQVPGGYKSVPSYIDVLTGSTDNDELSKLLNEK